MTYTVDLYTTLAGADVIGSKAASLVTLHRAGFRVPRGICVTTTAYRAWREAGGLTDELRRVLLEAYGALQGPLAVRSSSPAEDLADASFAGQYATVLGVCGAERLLQAMETCWRSADSAASSAYRTARAAEQPVEMAVLIQELVPADAAGVMFTMHPVTDRVDRVVINSNFGVGDSVVSGHAEPDTFVLDKRTGVQLEAQAGTKRVYSRPDAEGVREVPLEAARQQRLSLDAGQLAQLVEAARRLEAHYDAPMDCEWAFVGDTLYMLQARPVTTGFPAYHGWLLDEWARDRRLDDDPAGAWVRGSVLSGLRVSPLYYSEMSPFFADMFVRIAALHGAPAIRRKIFHYFRGYTYTDALFSSTADPPGDIQPESPFGPAWKSNLRIALRHPLSLAFWTNIDYYYRKWHGEWWPAVNARRPDAARASPAEIRDFIEFIEVQRRDRSVVAGLAVGYAPNFVGLLAYLLQRWAPDAPRESLGLLTSGLPDSMTHDENVALWQLTQKAERSPAVREALVAERWEGLATVAGGAEFLAAADAFRERHAHRGCSDRDIYQPRWGDDRPLLLRQVKMILGLGPLADPVAAHARTAAKRAAHEREILEQVGRGPLGFARRRVFERVLRTTQRYVMHRDNQRHTFEPYFLELRRAYRAIGDKLAARGVLDHGEDVFFLGKHEIYAHIDGRLADHVLGQRARWRRKWWEQVTCEEPPPRLAGNRPADPVAADAGPADLKGSPGAPGVVTGPVRKIASLEELQRVRPGDIVVTYAIDPAWTPVFGIIAGVVSVEGGMLAHAAVLGREYGIPVVLAVRDAVGRLNDGDVIRIDGTAGTVNIVADAAA